MNELNVKLVRIINGYDPNKRDMLCKIDIIKLSQMEALQNPTSDKKEVVEAFLGYASAVVGNHPSAHLNENIEKMFGTALEEMKKIAPEAYQKYEAAQNKNALPNLNMKREAYVAGL